MSDIIERLRATDLLYNRGPHYEPVRCEPSDLRLEAANEIARLRTELEAAKGDAVGVKALEWEHHPQATGQVRAPSAIGTYRIPHFGDYALWGRLPERLTEKAETIEEAKAAAQADFERRIRSAITADKSEAEVRQQEQIREDEREACARIAEDEDGHFSHYGLDRNTNLAREVCRAAASAIRARSRAQGGMDNAI